MNRIMIIQDAQDNIVMQKRGAKVYGIPTTKELISYMDDVSPYANQQRLFEMFFAGKIAPITINGPVFEDESIEEL